MHTPCASMHADSTCGAAIMCSADAKGVARTLDAGITEAKEAGNDARSTDNAQEAPSKGASAETLHPRIGTGKKHPPVAGAHAELDAWDNNSGRKIKEAQPAKTKEAHNAKVGEADAKVGEADTKVSKADAKVGEADAKVGEADAKVGEADAKVSKANAKVCEAETKVSKVDNNAGETDARVRGADAEVASAKAQRPLTHRNTYSTN